MGGTVKPQFGRGIKPRLSAIHHSPFAILHSPVLPEVIGRQITQLHPTSLYSKQTEHAHPACRATAQMFGSSEVKNLWREQNGSANIGHFRHDFGFCDRSVGLYILNNKQQESFMAVLDPAQIRNIAFVGHSGCGKTSLAEALLHKTGMTTRLGNVADKTSILDYTEESREKLHSLDSAVAFANYKNHHINIIDTPGSLAFSGISISSLAAVETAVVVVSASAGIQVNTRKMLERAQNYGIGVWLVINHIDAPNVNLPALLKQIQESFGAQCVPITLPSEGGKKVVNCFTTPSGKADFGDVAASHTAIIEASIASDDALMEQYLAGELADDEAGKTAAKSVAAGAFIPVFFTNARADVGITDLLDALITFAPSPVTGKKRELVDGESKTPIPCDPNGPFVGKVFKISTDPKSHIKYLTIRILSGKLTSDMTLKTVTETKGVRPGHVLRVFGAEHKDMEFGTAGDIVSLAKLDFHIGDTLCGGKIGKVGMPDFPKPMFSLALESKVRGDEDKISGALKRFAEEDPCFVSERGTGGELVVRGMGDNQLRTYLDRMHKQYKLDVITHPPRIPYRETITGRAENIEYTHKKQSGGAGQFGKVIINVMANERGKGYEFVDKIFGGAIDQPFRVSTDKGIKLQLAEGVLAGYPIVDVVVELIDGKTHPVDSKDIAFQIAGRGAFKEGFMKAKPVLLEPIVEIEVVVPAANMGDITGDLASRRGRPHGQDMLPGGMAIIKASVPLSEVAEYNSRLSSITGGQGSYSMELSHYDVVPPNVQAQVVEHAKKHMVHHAEH